MAELNGHLAGSDDRTELAEKPDSVWLDPMTGEPSVEEDDDVTLLRVLGRIYDGIFISDGAGSLSRRFRSSLSENFPRLRRACKNSGSELLLWARRGSPLRALLVISVSPIFDDLLCLERAIGDDPISDHLLIFIIFMIRKSWFLNFASASSAAFCLPSSC